MTSWPMRGIAMWPQVAPAMFCDTRIQQELCPSCLPKRSQGKCTFTRPNASVWISSLGGPTTNAFCGPSSRGLARGSARHSASSGTSSAS
ncbi:hypothetical protein D3C72_2356030 [compost metagenome]